MHKRLLLIVLFVSLTSNPLCAFDPPEIIGILEASDPTVNNFGDDYTCVGDHNGDGFDDLLVSHGYWVHGYRDSVFSNAVELFYGGEEMDDEPDFVLSENGRGPISLGRYVNFLGWITDSENPYWAVQSNYYRVYPTMPLYRVNIYEAGSELDDEPEFVFESEVAAGYALGEGFRTKPADFNGDGYHDFIVSTRIDRVNKVQIFFGSADFDMDPDWIKTLNSGTGPSTIVYGKMQRYSAGYDVNNDGYDDLLLQTREKFNDNIRDYRYHYSIYLGGEQMDTIPEFTIDQYHFEGEVMEGDFKMVPDINDDGFDDWIIHHYASRDYSDQGYYVFYGSDEPDSEPELDLPGGEGEWHDFGCIAGGDLNGNGVGDVMTVSLGAWQEDGAMSLYFGSDQFEGEPNFTFNLSRDWGHWMGNNAGGTGDYNGDGIDDFIVKARVNPVRVYVLTHAENWTGVRDTKPDLPSEMLMVDIRPNPFNSSLNITLTQPNTDEIKVSIHDLQGRTVATLHEGQLTTGNHLFSWDASGYAAGVYLVVAVGNGVRETRKVVLIR